MSQVSHSQKTWGASEKAPYGAIGERKGGERPTLCPIVCYMRKTSVYLQDEQAERLARLAANEGRSQADVLREAIARYEPKASPDRVFALEGVVSTSGGSIADCDEQELLTGFGE